MRMKRLAALAVIMTLLTLALAGCGPDTTKPDVIVTPPVEAPAETSAQATEQPEATEAPEAPEQPEAPTAEYGFDAGKTLPDFSVPMTGGGTFTLSEKLGKPVFINLFATWCPPCVAEMPEIEQLYTEMGGEVEFIIIDIGEDEATAQGFMDSSGYTLPTAYSIDGAPFGSDYLIQFIPQTFVLKPGGTISEIFGGAANYESFKTAIEEAMAQ